MAIDVLALIIYSENADEVIIKNINDSKENAIELSNLLKNINCKINIIPYNEKDLYYSGNWH